MPASATANAGERREKQRHLVMDAVQDQQRRRTGSAPARRSSVRGARACADAASVSSTHCSARNAALVIARRVEHVVAVERRRPALQLTKCPSSSAAWLHGTSS